MLCLRLVKKDPQAKGIVGWNREENSVVIENPEKLNLILGKHFRSNKTKALVRQLNIHDFKRDKTKAKISYFHPMFKRNGEDLKYIERVDVKSKRKDQEDIEFEKTEDYKNLIEQVCFQRKNKEEKIKKIKEFNARRRYFIKEHEARVRVKNKRLLKMLYLLSKTEGDFNRKRLLHLYKQNPELKVVFDRLDNQLDESISSLLDVVGSLCSFEDFVDNFFIAMNTKKTEKEELKETMKTPSRLIISIFTRKSLTKQAEKIEEKTLTHSKDLETICSLKLSEKSSQLDKNNSDVEEKAFKI